nr:LuxR C-terminal-related transcriptional regulator [Nocardioides immobilis]
MGGVGKTRFARRLASEVRGTFPDGVWLVELADLRQGSLLAQTIGGALGIRDESSDPIGTLADHLQERRLLLLLDNCEHLTESCAMLIGNLLQSAPTLKIVATSRHVLGVEGEQVFSVAALTHESADEGPSEAMELFEQRAAAASPTFRITKDNQAVVAEICRALEGVPLAVELAAANARTFEPSEILERLQDDEVLTAGEWTRPLRHRTMHAAVEWSYRLCTPQEQQTWQQLSVFAGGFTAASAESVCSTTDPDSTVIGALMGLVDKSIIIRISGTHGAPARYRMLEPVRQYAADRLTESSNAHQVRRRHRDYFLELARRGVTDYCSRRDVEWFATTRQEQANIREALEFSLTDLHNPEVAAEMATALRSFWQQSGSILEGYRWLRRALTTTNKPTQRRAAALVAAAILGFLLEDSEEAHQLLREHLDLTATRGWDAFGAVARFASAFGAFADGDLGKAFEEAEKSVELGLGYESPGVVADAMSVSALYAFLIEHRQAEELATRFAEYTESHGSHLLKAVALYLLGAVRWRKGDTASATALMQDAIRLYRLFEHPAVVAVCIEGLAWCAADSEPVRAAALLGAANAIWKYSQMRLTQRAVHGVGGAIEVRLRQQLGDLGFEQAVARGGALDFEQAVALALGSTTGSNPKPGDAAGPAGLTRRERQIAALVAEGLTNKEIAAKLVISPRTAEAHVEHIFAKLGFRSRAQIVRWFSTHE